MQDNNLEYFNGPFLQKDKVYYRQYQENIVNKCYDKNTLVVLPTGLGKTIISILLAAKVLAKYPESKILILAPTRPLVSQHKSSCRIFLNIDSENIVSFTGKVKPQKRALLFNSSQIIISTPQVIKNDIERKRYNLKYVSLIIFDEGHRTKGNYAYNFISDEYMNSCSYPLILALTASPGKNFDTIQQLCDNLFIEKVVFKSYDDQDVKKYMYDIDTYLEFLNVPIKILEISSVWYHLFKKFLRLFIDWNLLAPNKAYYSKLDFLGITQDLTLSLRYENGYEPDLSDQDYNDLLYYKSPKVIDIIKEKEINIQTVYSYCASCISILHGKDLLETQNFTLFNSFLDRLESKSEQDVLSARRITNSKHFKFIKEKLEQSCLEDLIHPKIEKIISLIEQEIQEYDNRKILIFTQYREMAEFLKNIIKEHFNNRISVKKFIGQTSKYNDMGFSQTKQIEILNEFREGQINILIATSVAEEGLDIPNVDAIIFYEPIPSEIRLIQRRGRTGRHSPGRCYILLTRETVDIPFHRVAVRKENTMNFILSDPKNLELCEDIEREKIDFSNRPVYKNHVDFIKKFKERRIHEKELLVNRSIDKITTEIDSFIKSEEYRKLNKYGVTIFNEVVNINKKKMRNSLLKAKGGRKKKLKEKRKRINKKVRTLLNIIKLYGENGVLNFLKFQDFAREEEICDEKFYAYFNQARYLGYLKKCAENVELIREYE